MNKNVLIINSLNVTSDLIINTLSQNGCYVYAGIPYTLDSREIKNANIQSVLLDISDPDSLDSVFELIEQAGGLSGIINVFDKERMGLGYSKKDFEEQIVWYLKIIEKYIPLLKSGKIINIMPPFKLFSLNRVSLNALEMFLAFNKDNIKSVTVDSSCFDIKNGGGQLGKTILDILSEKNPRKVYSCSLVSWIENVGSVFNKK